MIFNTKIIAEPSKLASISIRVFQDAGYCVFDSQKRAWDPQKLLCASFGTRNNLCRSEERINDFVFKSNSCIKFGEFTFGFAICLP